MAKRLSNQKEPPQELADIQKQLNQVILGNPTAVKLSLVCLLAQGHLLIEDIPGVGKTTLAQSLANVLGLAFKRVQFTSDLMPSDVLGVTVYDIDAKKFNFKRGPIFTSVLLGDEINRATPKTQSALLQAMEEYQVSVDGHTFELKQPFFVIATQNPLEQSGTFPLPESQLDRFLIRLSLGYPDQTHEKQILSGNYVKKTVKPAVTSEQLLLHIDACKNIHVSDAVIDYLWSIINASRNSDLFVTGLSPRAGIQWLRAARALAYIDGYKSVLPDHVKQLAPYVASHRLAHRTNNLTSSNSIEKLLEQVAAP